MIYGIKITEPAKQTNPIFLRNKKDFSLRRRRPKIICTIHLPPAIPVESII
jgi:hypothetical protein